MIVETKLKHFRIPAQGIKHDFTHALTAIVAHSMRTAGTGPRLSGRLQKISNSKYEAWLCSLHISCKTVI